MDFREEYKRENEGLLPREDFTSSLARDMRAELRSPKKKKHTQRTSHEAERVFNHKMVAKLTGGICCVLVVVLVAGLLQFSGALPLGEVPYFAYSEEYAGVWGAINTFCSEANDSVTSKNYSLKNDISTFFSLGGMESDSAQYDIADVDGVGTSPDTSDADYSDTNIQVAGVQEADIVKTDGNHIYIVRDDFVEIASAQNGELERLSTLDFSGYVDGGTTIASGYVSDLYVTGGKLVVTRVIQTYVRVSNLSSYFYYNYYSSSQTVIDVYDVSNAASPEHEKTFKLDGYSLSSRMIGSTLYLVNRYYPATNVLKQDNLKTYVPAYFDGESDQLVAADDIHVADPTLNASYVVVAGIETSGEPAVVSTSAILGGGTEIYADLDNLYVFGYVYNSETVGNRTTSSTDTLISKFSLANGEATYLTSAEVKGKILNQFSADENGGNLRIVTTVSSSEYVDNVSGEYSSRTWLESEKYSVLYVLDSSLQKLSESTHFGADEEVKSVRYLGDVAYVVTFRNTDPLFAIDVSNPNSPRILSELHMPGFSDYMHPYGTGMLFGFGRQANEDSGSVTGLKLSMFDITDPSYVTVLANSVDNSVTWSPACDDHKAILVDSAKNIIGFSTDNGYQIYSYNADTSEFVRLAELRTDNYTDGFWYNSNEVRGLFIGDYFYVSWANGLSSFDMTTYDVCDCLFFD